MTVTLRAGDCVDLMAELPDHSVDAVVTDPPYNLGFMGKDWDTVGSPQAFQSWTERWGRQALRVLKPGGYLLAFSGTRTYHRTASGLEDAGFRVRDMVNWLHGQGFPKSQNIALALDKQAGATGARGVAFSVAGKGNRADLHQNERQDPGPYTPITELAQKWAGWGTALKPGHEPVAVCQKPLAGTIAGTVAKWGTGALNVDACRLGTSRPPTVHHAFTALRRMEGRTDLQEPKPDLDTNKGRWPANVVLVHGPNCEDSACGADCPVALLDAQSGVTKSTSSGARPAGNRAGGNSLRMSVSGMPQDIVLYRVNTYTDRGGASRFYFTAKPSKQERGEGNNHPTVKPVAAMRWLVRLVTPAGGTVLDPFLGSGTTALAAVLEGASFIGFDLNPDYVTLAQSRLDNLSIS